MFPSRSSPTRTRILRYIAIGCFCYSLGSSPFPGGRGGELGDKAKHLGSTFGQPVWAGHP